MKKSNEEKEGIERWNEEEEEEVTRLCGTD